MATRCELLGEGRRDPERCDQGFSLAPTGDRGVSKSGATDMGILKKRGPSLHPEMLELRMSESQRADIAHAGFSFSCWFLCLLQPR